MPIDPRTGFPGSACDRAIRLDYGEAVDVAQRHLGGIGYALPEDRSLWVVSLEYAWDTDAKRVKPWAAALATLDTYVERSPSGTGLTLFARGEIPTELAESLRAGGNHDVRVLGPWQFAPITGQRLPGAPLRITPVRAVIDESVIRTMSNGPGRRERIAVGQRTTAPVG